MDICPFLGLIEDAQTPALFPFERNCCYHLRKAAPLDTEHQRTHCLAPMYRECQVFLSDPPPTSLPQPLRAPRVSARPAAGPVSRNWLLLIFIVCVGLGLTLYYWPKQASLPNPPRATATVATPAAASAVPLIIINTLLPRETALPSPVPTATLTLTPTKLLPAGVETPIGHAPQLLIHRVLQGESLQVLANRYGTSLKAIQKINYYLPVPLWEGWMVVIPLNTTDVSLLPVFEAFQVAESQLTLQEVAQLQDADPELMQKFNMLQADYVLPLDSWLLIPRQAPKVP